MAQDAVLFNGLEISQGTYDDGVTTENSLVANLMQFPEILDAVYMAFPKYSMANMKSALYDLPEMSSGDIKVRYPVLGRLEKALTMTGNSSGTFLPNQTSFIEFYEDFGNPTSTWRFGNGQQIYIVDRPSQTATGFMYPVKYTAGQSTDTFDTSQIVDLKQIGHIGNLNPQGSKRGYGNTRFPDWFENYNSIARKRQEVDGTAASAITWLRAGDQAYWIPGAAWGNNGFVNTMFGGQKDGGFLYLQERMAWYQKGTVDSNGQPTLYDVDGKPVWAGDGVFEQVPSAMSFDYVVGGTTEKFWIDRLAAFKQNSGQMTNQRTSLDIEGGIGFVAEWTKTMKDFVVRPDRGIAGGYNINDYKITAGYDIPMYYVLDTLVTVNENPVFSDDVLLTEADAITGLPSDSYDFVMIDRTKSDGIPTIQKIVKKGRGFVYKTVSGMVDPINPASTTAANSWDGWAVELLADFQYIVRKPNCIARGFAIQ